MGLFSSKKNDGSKNSMGADFEEAKAFSMQAIELATPEIEKTDSFLPFGGILTTDNTFQMVVYTDPNKKTIDHREHATIIQNIMQKKYTDPKNLLFFMAWDGVAHLKTGDIDCINVKVDNKFLNTHRIFIYTYKKNNGKVELVDKDNPIIKDL
jgi:hypothetical protein